MSQFLKTIESNPRLILAVDGAGALLTATLLLGVLGTFSNHFGVPSSVITKLVLAAVLFALYSFSCFFLAHHKWRFFLRIIASANLLYCGLTALLLFAHREQLTYLAWAYFSLELPIVIALAFFELKVASTASHP